MGPFDYHIFAHKGGRYQTTDVSPTITPAEKAMLEQYFFGQSNDDAYLSSLATAPGIIWRRIEDRFALTRVLAGQRDANGRATLRFETLLIAGEAADTLASAVAPVALAKWQRYGQQFVVAGPRQTMTDDLHPDIVSQAALAFQSTQRAVLRSDAASLADVQAIIKRCFRDQGFSLCYKCLNDKAPIAINFAWGSSTRGAPAVRQSETPMPKLPAVPTKTPRAFSTGVALATAVVLLLVVVQFGLLLQFKALLAELKSAQGDTQQAVLDRIEAKSQTVLGDVKATGERLLASYQGDTARVFQKVDASSGLISGVADDIRKVGKDVSAISQVATTLPSSIQALQFDVGNLKQDVQRQGTTQPAEQRPTAGAGQDAGMRLEWMKGRMAGAKDDVESILDSAKRVKKAERASDRDVAIESLIKQVEKLRSAIMSVLQEERPKPAGNPQGAPS